MTTSVVSPPQARAHSVEFVSDAFVVHLEDGRSLKVPLEWFPRLRDATAKQRKRWRLIGPGFDEHISVAGPSRSSRLISLANHDHGDTAVSGLDEARRAVSAEK